MKSLLTLTIILFIGMCKNSERASAHQAKSEFICFKLKTKCVCERFLGFGNNQTATSFAVECSEVEGFEFRKEQ